MTTVRVIDLESTGLEPPEHKVVEIGWCVVTVETAAVDRNMAIWTVEGGGQVFFNPGRQIPPEASAIHHIVDQDVAGGARWDDAASSYLHNDFLEVDERPFAVLAAHNAKFERQWCTDDLTGGLPWICTYKSALRLWPDAPSHSNQVLRYWKNPAGLDRMTADISHRAWPDAYVTAHLLREMLNEGASIEQLIAWSDEPALLTKVGFGKHFGSLWTEVPTGYLEWILGQDFDEDVAFTARHELERRRSVAPANQPDRRTP